MRCPICNNLVDPVCSEDWVRILDKHKDKETSQQSMQRVLLAIRSWDQSCMLCGGQSVMPTELRDAVFGCCTPPVPKFRTYICKVRNYEAIPYVATSSSKARYQCYLDLLQAGFCFKLIEIKVHSMKQLITDGNFIANAKYRGISYAKIGTRVKVGENMGTIVGHNSSANLNVVFDKNPNITLNCHPNCNITYYDEEGKVVGQYN